MPSIKETLLHLKSRVDEAYASKQLSDEPHNFEHYQTQILPHLLALRAINRHEKHELEGKFQKKKELYQELLNLQQQSECLEFEASCLGSDVDSIRQETNDDCTMRNGSDVDHDTRMQLLDVEEARRRDLQKKLLELTEETKEIELSCSRRTDQLNLVKPYIKQLLEKAGSK